MELLREDAVQRERGRDQKADSSDEQAPEERRAVICRACETEVTDSRFLFAMRSTSPVQAFPNPYGQMRVILTFRDAHSLTVSGDPTTDFTWFAGYAWRVAYCGECKSHLGWMFEAMEASDPKTFFGLLKEMIVER